jgi:5'-3' exonuclease
MLVHLIDGTYELFRFFFGAPSYKNAQGKEVGATRALLRSYASWLGKGEVTHLAAAFDHVIESFRNDLFDGYKTGEGIDPDLFGQFELAERALRALGIVVWPMIEFEADDAVAAGAARYAKDRKVSQVLLCSPDKDLAQCVSGKRVVMWDRVRDKILDEKAVIEKFGVPPAAIPDLLALVGDSADGIPGLPRWGMKSAAAILAAYGSLEAIPRESQNWKVKIRGAEALAESLRQGHKDALLFRRLATLRLDVPLREKLEELEWRGADRKALEAIAREVKDETLLSKVEKFR